MQPDTQSTLAALQKLLERSYWTQGDFWIHSVIGLAELTVGGFGLYYAYQAFVEAEQAKVAAQEAGRTVRLQTITIELNEIAQRLTSIRPNISYSEARDFHAEVSRRTRRAVSPFAKDLKFEAAIAIVLESLQAAKASLKTVRPLDPTKEGETPYAVYNAIEQDFATISESLADLLGLMEKQTFDFGEEDAE
jgi:hypothetical protein